MTDLKDLLFLTEGQIDYDDAEILLERLPEGVKRLATDRAYDGNWVSDTSKSKGITPCIPVRKNQKEPIVCDTEFYKERHKLKTLLQNKGPAKSSDPL